MERGKQDDGGNVPHNTEPGHDAAEAVVKKHLVLRDLLQDVYEYKGCTAMGLFLCYFVYTVVFTGFNWSENQAFFHSNVVESLQAYGPTDWQQTSAENQESIGTGFTYATGYVKQLMNDSQSNNLLVQQLSFNQYNQVELLRLVVDVTSSCALTELHCYLTDPLADSLGYAASEPGILPSQVWAAVVNPPFYTYGPGTFMSTVLYNRSNVTDTWDFMKDRMKALEADEAFIGRYAIEIRLEMVVHHDRQYEANSTVYFAQVWSLRSMSRGTDSFIVRHTTATVPVKASFTSSSWDYMRLFMLVAYILVITAYLAGESDLMRLSMRQYAVCARNHVARARAADGSHALGGLTCQKYISKMVRLGLFRYFTSWWNLIDWASTLISLLWAFGWAYIIATAAANQATFQGYMESEDNLNKLLDFSNVYTVFIYIGIFNVFLVGIRLYKYMKYHSGLRVYYNLFIAAWRAIKDFGLWFIYVMLVLASTVIMIFQISGGNTLFSIRADGINAMALVTFGALDYETFVNKSLGLGNFAPIAIGLFWVNTAILSTIAMNILIAIVGEAYAEARQKEGAIEHTLIYIVWLRLLFNGRYIWRVWIKRMPLHSFVQFWVQIVIKEVNEDPLSVAHEFRYSSKSSWTTIRVAKLYARWAIGLLPESQTLLAYFLDSGSNTICRRSPWEDEESVEEKLTEVAATHKRHRPRLPTPAWCIDTAMDRGQVSAFMIALASSGAAGLLWDLDMAASGNSGKSTLAPLGDPNTHELQSAKGWTPEPVLPATEASSGDCLLCIKSMFWRPLPHDLEMGLAWADGNISHADFISMATRLGNELDELDKLRLYLQQPMGQEDRVSARGKNKVMPWSEETEVIPYKIASDEPQPSSQARNPDNDHSSVAVASRKWTAAAVLLKEYKESGSPTADCDSVYLGSLAILRQAMRLPTAISASLSGLLTYRPLFGLQSPPLRWDMRMVAEHYASWIWEVYSAEMIGDEDWNESLDEMDLKILELKEQLPALMHARLAAPNGSLQSHRDGRQYSKTNSKRSYSPT